MSKDIVEQIADCLLQNHMELMAEVKHLRDELERLLVRTPVGLELHEMDAIIDGNMTITDSKLRDAIYAVVLDTMHTVMEKNGLLPE